MIINENKIIKKLEKDNYNWSIGSTGIYSIEDEDTGVSLDYDMESDMFKLNIGSVTFDIYEYEQAIQNYNKLIEIVNNSDTWY